jgi:hypothetical protein
MNSNSTPNYKALCVELSFIWSRSTNPDDLFENMIPLVGRARAALAQPEQQWPADGEAAELVAVFRKVASEDPGVVQIDPLWLTRAADLLERLASDNAGLAAAADSLWADNMSLLDSHHD